MSEGDRWLERGPEGRINFKPFCRVCGAPRTGPNPVKCQGAFCSDACKRRYNRDRARALGAARRLKPDGRSMWGLWLWPREKAALRRLAPAYGTMTEVARSGILLLDRPARDPAEEEILGLALSGLSPDEAVRECLSLFAREVAHAWKSNARSFAPEDWGMMADSSAGTDLRARAGARPCRAGLARDVEVSHAREGLGGRWYPAGEADARVARLVERLWNLGPARGHALLCALRRLWANLRQGDEALVRRARWWEPDFWGLSPPGGSPSS